MTLERFVDAQRDAYEQALSEVRAGKKASHWMWFIFPQLKGLGRTDTARFYGIAGLAEAQAYLRHPVLGPRLEEIAAALLDLGQHDPHAIFGSPDDLKLRSSMTLFAHAGGGAVFQQVLAQYYNGKEDDMTLELLAQHDGNRT
jgi:uncharacterized protein (DUF1810 family)